jgi:UDP-N-acetylglucosamine--N-acetylmuramyl-(pentapeptide) pyrophosphoryl-undecaprenol N-acetylglucosamine transferase
MLTLNIRRRPAAQLKVLYGVSPIGLGHATRAVAVGEELASEGADPLFATGGNAAGFIRSYGFEVEDVVTEPVPHVVHGEMKNASLWYLRYWIGFRRSKKRIGHLMARIRPDLVVGDEEFAGLELAKERGLRHAMISDELELGFARSWLAERIERRAERWYRALAQSVDMLIVPDEGKDEGNVHHVGPIVRNATKSREEVRSELSIPSGQRIVFLSLSGAGLSNHLVEPTIEAVRGAADVTLLIAGNRGKKIEGQRVNDLGVVRDNQNLVAAADLVVSTAGKSTIDEAFNFGTPIIAIPMKNHAEQERNGSALGYRFEDVHRLGELVRSKLGKRMDPRSFDGAKRVAELLREAAS